MSLIDASTTLWIDPDDDAAGGVTTTDNGSAVDVTGFAFRQAKNIGAMLIDNLKSGTSLGDVTDGGGNDLAILSQPVSQTMLTGKTISFSVVATGVEPLAYQWSKDGADIDGATASALELADVVGGRCRRLCGDCQQRRWRSGERHSHARGAGFARRRRVTIKHLRSLVDDNREPSDTKTIFTAEGHRNHAHEHDRRQPLAVLFQDDTAGIAVYFRNGKSSHPKAGDKVRVSARWTITTACCSSCRMPATALHLVKVVSSDKRIARASPARFHAVG